jgi:hypothetical protein
MEKNKAFAYRVPIGDYDYLQCISLHGITVAGRGKISEPSTAGTSNLDWRCFEYY